MAFDGITLSCVVKELCDKIVGLKIDKISQPEKDEIIMSFRGDKNNYRLLLSANASLPRMYLLDSTKKENPLKAPTFLMLLRKHILGGRIIDIKQNGFDRTVEIIISAVDELQKIVAKKLIIEIMGRHSNIILVETDQGKVIDSIKRIPQSVSSYRQVLPGSVYKYPPEQNKLDPTKNISLQDFMKYVCVKTPVYKSIYTTFSGISPLIAKEICYRSEILHSSMANEISPIQLQTLHSTFLKMMEKVKSAAFEPCLVLNKDGSTVDFSSIYLSMYEGLKIKASHSICQICEEYYNHRDKKERLNQKTHDIRKILSNKINVLSNKIEKQSIELKETEKKDEFKKKADLLTSYIYMIKDGAEEVTVDDFYKTPVEKTTIKLDENLTPSQNIQKLYKKYNKLKVREVELTRQISYSKKMMYYLQNIEFSLENVEDIDEFNGIIQEMTREGIIKGRKNARNNKSKSNSEKDSFNPMRFVSSDGHNIYVGKNNKQNDYLTMKFANDDDMWLHTKDIAGSHVIIKPKNKEISDTSIKEAALIAGYYSKARASQNVPIDYTLKRNVKKPKGAKNGMVIYETNSTIYVTPDESKVKELELK